MNPSKSGIAALLGAVTIWGSTFVVTKLLMVGIGPFLVTGLRLIISLVVITPFALRRGFKWRYLIERKFLFYGLTGVALYFGLSNTGLYVSTSANAALIQSVNPAAVALLSVIFLQENVSWRRGLGIGLSVIGVLLIAGIPSEGGKSTLFGNILIIGSVIAWAVYTIQGKKLDGNIDPLTATTASFYTGLAWLLPFMVWEISRSGIPSIGFSSWAALIYLGVVASAVGFFLWNKALRSVDASIAGPFINLIPIIGLVLAIVSGEKVKGLQFIGGGIAIIGVLITQNILFFRKRSFHENSSTTH